MRLLSACATPKPVSQRVVSRDSGVLTPPASTLAKHQPVKYQALPNLGSPRAFIV